MAETYITKALAAELLHVTEHAIKKRIYSCHSIRTRHSPHISLNGKRPKLVCLEDLGDDAVNRYYAQLQSQVPTAEEPPRLQRRQSQDPLLCPNALSGLLKRPLSG